MPSENRGICEFLCPSGALIAIPPRNNASRTASIHNNRPRQRDESHAVPNVAFSIRTHVLHASPAVGPLRTEHEITPSLHMQSYSGRKSTGRRPEGYAYGRSRTHAMHELKCYCTRLLCAGAYQKASQYFSLRVHSCTANKTQMSRNRDKPPKRDNCSSKRVIFVANRVLGGHTLSHCILPP